MRIFPNHSIHTSPMCISEGQVLHVRVIADISARDVICCSILNPKCLLQSHQLRTYLVKRIHHSIPNNITVFLLRVTITFWWYRFLTRRPLASQTCASQNLLTTTLTNDLLCYDQSIAITVTYWKLVTMIINRHLTRAGHDVWGRVMQQLCYINTEGSGDAVIWRKFWYINTEVSGNADFNQNHSLLVQRGWVMMVSRKNMVYQCQGISWCIFLANKWCINEEGWGDAVIRKKLWFINAEETCDSESDDVIGRILWYINAEGSDDAVIKKNHGISMHRKHMML